MTEKWVELCATKVIKKGNIIQIRTAKRIIHDTRNQSRYIRIAQPIHKLIKKIRIKDTSIIIKFIKTAGFLNFIPAFYIISTILLDFNSRFSAL